MKNICSCLLIVIIIAAQAQTNPHCGTDAAMANALAKDPSYAERIAASDTASRSFNRRIPKNRQSCNISFIPVVVHILHQNGPENISDAQIFSQIKALNEDFRKTPGSAGDGGGVDTEFGFFLARKDTAGAATTGITRTVSTCSFGGSESCVKSNQWDPVRYLNIWVVSSIDNGSDAYTYLPGITPSLDGVVIRHQVFGTQGTVSVPRELGHTLSHEVGHWLGLYHTFNSGCKGTKQTDCFIAGDKVCDTPPSYQANWNCPSGVNSCTESPADTADQIDNYMDYTDDNCRNRFTAGQRDRMQAQAAQHRSTIYSQANLDATGFDGTCSTGIVSGGEKEPAWHIYPNPSRGSLTVECPANSHLEIMDMHGKVWRTAGGSISVTLDLSGLDAGLYILRSTGKNFTFTSKVLLQHP